MTAVPRTRVARIVKLLDTNKAKAAFLAPLMLAVASALGSWLVTGNFEDTEIRLAASGAILAAVSGWAAYTVPADTAVVETAPVEPPLG